MNINERMTIVETKITGMQRILWILVTTSLAQVGVQII